MGRFVSRPSGSTGPTPNWRAKHPVQRRGGRHRAIGQAKRRSFDPANCSANTPHTCDLPVPGGPTSSPIASPVSMPRVKRSTASAVEPDRDVTRERWERMGTGGKGLLVGAIDVRRRSSAVESRSISGGERFCEGSVRHFDDRAGLIPIIVAEPHNFNPATRWTIRHANFHPPTAIAGLTTHSCR